MPYVTFRNGIAQYSRRIPKAVAKHDSREKIRISLHTDSPKIAEQLSIQVNEEVEAYWRQLVTTGTLHHEDAFAHVQELANRLGFTYRTNQELVEAPIEKLFDRLQLLEQVYDKPAYVEALVGGASQPELCLSEALNRFWELTKGELTEKSDEQVRKWRNPRDKAIRNAIGFMGDKALVSITQEDIIRFRDWWIDRIAKEDIKPKTVNKELSLLRTIIKTVASHYRLNIDSNQLFQNAFIKETIKRKRPPFETSFIQGQLLNPIHHTDISDEARYFLYAMADTGARVSELVGLLPEEIVLEAPIPYIRIKARKGHALKNPYSERDIPLVGSALYAFEQIPNGFRHYQGLKGGAESLSQMLMKHLRAKNLLPTDDHTLYSLRHSFQDRLTKVGVPDRVQVQLMGHRFQRTEYGEGASLETKKEWLQRICFETPTDN